MWNTPTMRNNGYRSNVPDVSQLLEGHDIKCSRAKYSHALGPIRSVNVAAGDRAGASSVGRLGRLVAPTWHSYI